MEHVIQSVLNWLDDPEIGPAITQEDHEFLEVLVQPDRVSDAFALYEALTAPYLPSPGLVDGESPPIRPLFGQVPSELSISRNSSLINAPIKPISKFAWLRRVFREQALRGGRMAFAERL